MNNNKTDENALLAGGKGVFQKTSYITFGDKENPEPFVWKQVDRDGYKGKQLQTNPPKTGRLPNTYFEKKHLWVSEGDGYTDQTRYLDSQKTKSKGFLTSDFSRRDEFSNTTRTEQYRTLLKSEAKFAKKALERLSRVPGGIVETTTYLPPANQQPRQYLYDLIHEDNNASDGVLDGSSKLAHDTKNPTALGPERNLGSYRTTTSLAHGAPTEFQKPQFARKPVVQESFYRRTNVFFPDGCATIATTS
ncbi:hypothetical protein WJX84_002028 [Apatococcus fuscideae]|uniref:Flagellar associated protein n=1 Tax=Apatococcus fuscideae TaxID=2026836 RepID=A0AAW1RXQ0_9CHLO